MHRRHPIRILLFAAVLLALVGRVTRAQDSTSILAPTNCTEHLPHSVFSRVAVYAYVHIDSGTNQRVRFAAENFLPDVATAITHLLHGAQGTLPMGDSAVDWRWADGSLRVTAFRNGRLTWRTDGRPHADGATRLLARALAAADSSGAAIPLSGIDDSQPPDSAVFWIKTGHPELDHSGRATPMRFEGTALPMFSLPIPWFEPAHELPGAQPPHYPDDARANDAIATVMEDFVVDSAGRVDSASIHEEWPARVPPPTGDKLRYWREFVASVRRVLPSFAFSPARVGGCPVAQRFRLPFQFWLGSAPPPLRDSLPE